MREINRRELETMPFDKTFETSENYQENCHATGYEVLFEGDDMWWNEYEDNEGNLHYGN